MLLTRDEFRNQVFERDSFKCVFCDAKAVDAHHILERRLFQDGGYYLNNGVSVCEEHHILCEQTLISVEDIREKINITKPILPPHLYDDYQYDKWGNIVLTNGTRLKGELFYDESVQKILKPVLNLFTDYVKYPRTYHLPWSEGATKDDRILSDVSQFFNREVVVSEKIDGENTSGYNNYIHARSLEMNQHPSTNWIKQFHASMSYNIPEGMRICGENVYAKHSIHYKNLSTYFYGFSMWDKHKCLSWDETLEWFELLNITPVPVLYRGTFDEEKIKSLFKPIHDNGDAMEGYVVRIVDSFEYGDFKKSVAKFVRKNHVTSEAHWRQGKMLIKNEIKVGE